MMQALTDTFFTKGWCRFPYDAALADWVSATLSTARATVSDPANVEWIRYQNTWFAGVNVLPNDTNGAAPDGPELSGDAITFARSISAQKEFAWDKAQVSVCYPGYPKPMEGETQAQHNFRLKRDAAHVDGLMGKGQPKRRFLNEPHLFILGIPMVETTPDASPFAVWEGSHEIMRDAFRKAYAGHAPQSWPETDVTDIYVEARRKCFEMCKRVEVHASPGEAYLVHRLALHGVAPWGADAEAGPDGRMICYFRPAAADFSSWLEAR